MKVFKAITVFTFTIFLLNSCNMNSVKTESLRVEGNMILNESGEQLIFHGVNFSDPDKLEKEGIWKKSHFEEAKSWGANIIRLPVHPVRWRDRGEEAYLELLDSAVVWATDLDLYLIIDWHSIGNLKAEKFQNPMYITNFQETKDFWNTIAVKYSGEPVIAFYELFNEPVAGSETFGLLSWEEWKLMNEELIDIIRNENPESLILVAGFNWAYDLSPVRDLPVEREGIIYVSHPYPQKREKPWESQWEEDWGFVSEKYPVMLTEIGFALPDEPGVHIPVYGDEEYGNAIVSFAADRNISWVVWCFDPQWSPLMYTDWDYTPTRQGEFFRKAMSEK